MHTEDLSIWGHGHIFNKTNFAAERGTLVVMWITASMMLVEIIAGWCYNSMALLADGWHMSSHTAAIGLSAFAYRAARRFAGDPRFAFGTWKIEVLGGFASAIFLLGVAAMMVFGSVERIVSPQEIHFPEAMVVAVIGLVVNLVCAVILGQAHSHEHHHHDEHSQIDLGHHDLNLKSAYLHVVADATTSVLAIVALAVGWIYGWLWLDPVMGIIGAGMVGVWAKKLVVETGKVLLDCEMDHPVVEKIREIVETNHKAGNNRLADIHVWRVGRQCFACAISVVTHDKDLTADHVRKKLSIHDEIAHSTVEIHWCNSSNS